MAPTPPPAIKICGLTTPDALSVALDEGASHVGFVFFPKSPRNIAPNDAAALRGLARGAKVVAVTVDATDTLLDTLTGTLRPDVLQLHGRETPERVAAVKARTNLPVLKAFSLRERDDLAAVALYEGVADGYLFDAKPPEGATLPGGNGVSFDWTLLQAFSSSTPWFLSGGLHAGNVAQALAIAQPFGLDVSSGVEQAPGQKDVGRIKEFFAAVRASPVATAA